MDTNDRNEIKQIVEATAKSYFPITRINFSQILQGLILAGVVWIGAEFKALSDKSITREAELRLLKEDVKELKGEIRSLRTALYNYTNGNDN